MKRKKHEILKGLIKKADLDSPALDFTSIVMEQIQVESKEELAIDPALKLLIEQNAIAKAPTDLTYLVMSQVKPLSIDRSYAGPIIGKKAWVIVSVTFIMLIAFLLLSDQYSASSQRVTSNHINISNELNVILHQLYSIPMIYIIAIISFSVLFTLDYLLRDIFMKSILRNLNNIGI